MGFYGMFFLSFMVGLSGAMSPGPLTVLTVSETARRGMSAPFLIMAGHALLELLATTGLSLGLLTVAGSPRFIGSVALLGGTAMFVMGLLMFHEALNHRFTLSSRGMKITRGKLHLVAMGAITSLSNPYWTVWWVTIAAGLLVTAAKSGPASVAAFYTGHLLADMSFYFVIGLAVTAGRKFIGGKAYRRIMAALALSLSGFGAWFVFKGWLAFR